MDGGTLIKKEACLMSKSVGKSVTRVDAYEKATGRAKYVADLCDQSALWPGSCTPPSPTAT